MKILFLCEKTDGSDGWSRYSKSLIRALEQRAQTCKEYSVRSNRIPSPLTMLTRPFLALGLAWRIWKYCRKNPVDIIHITVEPYALIIPFLPKHLQKKVVLTLHGSYAIRPLLMWQTRWLTQKYYKNIPHFIAVSHYTNKRVIEELKKMKQGQTAMHIEKHATVIHNGISLPQYAPLTAHRSPLTAHRILHVGGVKPIKGVLEAIAACAVYRDHYSKNFHLSIIGKYNPDDPYVRHVHARISECHLEHHVTLRGFVSQPELDKAYQTADLLLLPSRTFPNTFEGFGLVFVEANAHGVPVIGPNTSGAVEAIEEGVSGYHVDPESPEEIAERMHRILVEGRISPSACRAWAEKHAIWRMADAAEKVYRSLSSIDGS